MPVVPRNSPLFLGRSLSLSFSLFLPPLRPGHSVFSTLQALEEELFRMNIHFSHRAMEIKRLYRNFQKHYDPVFHQLKGPPFCFSTRQQQTLGRLLFSCRRLWASLACRSRNDWRVSLRRAFITLGWLTPKITKISNMEMMRERRSVDNTTDAPRFSTCQLSIIE